MPDTRLDYLAITDDIRICRLLNGMWQVSGAHGAIDAEAAINEMFAYVDAGLTTWDLADHYGPAEDLVGEFRRRFQAARGAEALAGLQFFTKWVPRPALMTRRAAEQAIDRSLRRMHTDALDLLQFHWWDYSDNGYLSALEHLMALVEEGKIRQLALTNFDTTHVRKIVEHGIKIVSNQVQYSLIDLRPQTRMADYCGRNHIRLLTYGTLCGGLLSERYLGQPEPGRAELDTASLRKYKQMIDAWGGWALFQELLAALKGIARKHNCTIANVAVRYILDRPAVGGVIIGTRLGVAEHIADNLRVFELALDADDLEQLNSVLARANDLMRAIGDCGDEYRS